MNYTSEKYWNVVSTKNAPKDLPVSQIHPELINALAFIADHPVMESFLEIGSQDGGTLWRWIQILELYGHGFVIDLPNGPFGGIKSNEKAAMWQSWIRGQQTLDLIYKNSHDDSTVEELKQKMASRNIKTLDFLFIDGDHTYEGAKKDFTLYEPFIRSGGLIAFHDIVKHIQNKDVEVDRFWNEIKDRYTYKEFIKNPQQGWAGIGVLIKK